HHHHRRADGGGQRGQLAEGRGPTEAAQGLRRGLLLDGRAEPGPHEDGAGPGAGDALGQRLPSAGAGHRRQGGAAHRLPGRGRHRHGGGDGRHEAGGRGAPVHQPGAVEGRPERAGPDVAGGARQCRRHGAGEPQGAAWHLPEPGRMEGARLHHERRGPGEEPARLAGVVHGQRRQEVKLLLLPALVVLAVFAAALAALFRWSLLEFVPGSLQTGGLTLANLRGVLAPQYLGAIRDTVVLSALTTVLTLVAAYPVAYALARTPSRRVRSAILVLTLAPFFTGAIVRTYAW